MISRTDDRLEIKRFSVGPLETNCYLIYGDSSRKGALIDPGFCDPAIASYVAEHGVEILFILNTHGHADHIMGDAAFGVPVMIHALDEPFLHDAMKNLSFFVNMRSPKINASRLLTGGDVIELGSLKLEVIHTPGHTPGGISILCGDALFSGDTLFMEGIGRTDCPGGDLRTLLESVKGKLLALPENVKVYPGHGPGTTIGHEKKFNPFL